MASKILVLGDVDGQLRTVLAKVAGLHAKNSFDLAIVAGNLFAESDDSVADLLDGKIKIPLPTYFTVGAHALPQQVVDRIENNEEICENLHYLGKRSTTKTSEGIKIVTLGGLLDSTIIGGLSKEQHLPYHTLDDARSLKGAHHADILLSTGWPADVLKGSKLVVAHDGTFPKGYAHISDLSAALKPRYHFSISPNFLEREPFFHVTDNASVKQVTRFISLATWGTPKQKSIYAFTLPRSIDATAPLPTGVTISPFITQRSDRKRPLSPDSYSRFGKHDRNGHHKRGRGGKGEKRPIPTPDECFFCLSNPNLATHLISSIGDDAYLTIAKGPLTTSGTNALCNVNFPAHALIIPFAHAPTLALIPKDDGLKTFIEMIRFKDALQAMIAKTSDNKLGSVTYEISRGRGIHTHFQFLPIPAETISKGLVEAAFRVEAENQSYPAFEVRDPGLGENDGDFFRVWLYTPPSDALAEGETRCLTMSFDDNLRFSLQFGRTVLAKLLGLEKRIQWRDCDQTKEEEEKDIEAFKKAFKDFDFTT